jgi:hypothetical protein
MHSEASPIGNLLHTIVPRYSLMDSGHGPFLELLIRCHCRCCLLATLPRGALRGHHGVNLDWSVPLLSNPPLVKHQLQLQFTRYPLFYAFYNLKRSL